MIVSAAVVTRGGKFKPCFPALVLADPNAPGCLAKPESVAIRAREPVGGRLVLIKPAGWTLTILINPAVLLSLNFDFR
jgi:hypothetical protein